MIIIGLDPGTKTGWAVCRDGKITDSGVQSFDLSRGESPGIRFLRFRRWLEDILELTKPEIVSFEHSFQRGRHAQELYHGFTTRILETAAAMRMETTHVAASTLKKWSTGKGNADKASMVNRAMNLTGRKLNPMNAPIPDDEADAILVALWAWEQVGKLQPPTQGALV